MGIDFQYPEGATPLDQDDAAGLLPSHISNRDELNEWEFLNVREGEGWAFGRKIDNERLLTVEFMLDLHKRMFGNTWRWAGQVRTKEVTPVGAAPESIRTLLTELCRDVAAQLASRSWSIKEIAARFHHRLVLIHPFPNGNGRFSRTMTDLLLATNDVPRFEWGADLIHDGASRREYIAALRSADAKDYRPLIELLKAN
jgi:Fic-DOC domain mobile mystery protein B